MSVIFGWQILSSFFVDIMSNRATIVLAPGASFMKLLRATLVSASRTKDGSEGFSSLDLSSEMAMRIRWRTSWRSGAARGGGARGAGGRGGGGGDGRGGDM